jgi:hypothetical protein
MDKLSGSLCITIVVCMSWQPECNNANHAVYSSRPHGRRSIVLSPSLPPSHACYLLQKLHRHHVHKFPKLCEFQTVSDSNQDEVDNNCVFFFQRLTFCYCPLCTRLVNSMDSLLVRLISMSLVTLTAWHGSNARGSGSVVRVFSWFLYFLFSSCKCVRVVQFNFFTILSHLLQVFWNNVPRHLMQSQIVAVLHMS